MNYKLVAILILLQTNFILAGYDDPFYDYRGANPFREDHPFQHEERFDPFTGNIHIIYTDVYLPGNGGLDLRIVRVYNSSIRRYYYGIWQFVPDSWVGLGWSLHMGRLVCPSYPEYKYLEMTDGSKHTFYSDKNNAGQWISKEYLILKKTAIGYEVLFTNGVKWTFNDNIYGHISEEGGPIPYYPTKIISDPVGNQIRIFYDKINDQPLIEKIIDSCNRQVNFGYDTTGAMNLNYIEVRGQYIDIIMRILLMVTRF